MVDDLAMGDYTEKHMKIALLSYKGFSHIAWTRDKCPPDVCLSIFLFILFCFIFVHLFYLFVSLFLFLTIHFSTCVPRRDQGCPPT